MILIGITGFKGCGKTSFAKALTEEIKNNFYRSVLLSPFARPLKITSEAIFGKAKWYGTDAEKAMELPYWHNLLGEKYSSVRRILQTLGTDVFRAIHPQIWIEAQRMYLQQQGSLDIVIIDDVRFENEADFVRKGNGQLIHVVRMGVSSQDKHASEAGVKVSDNDLRFDFESLDAMRKEARLITANLIKQTKAFKL